MSDSVADVQRTARDEIRHFEGSVVKITADGREVLSNHLLPGERLKKDRFQSVPSEREQQRAAELASGPVPVEPAEDVRLESNTPTDSDTDPGIQPEGPVATEAPAPNEENTTTVEDPEDRTEEPSPEPPHDPEASSEQDPGVDTHENSAEDTLEGKSKDELYAIASELEIEHRSSMNKEELRAAIESHRNS